MKKLMDKVVYRHLKPNGEVFYIGIGDVRRAYIKAGRSELWRRTVDKYGYEVQILKSNLTWEEAVELEYTLIDYYGRIDLGTGTLVNFTDGGEGMLGHKHSEESRKKISEAQKGKTHSERVKAKISEAMKGKKLSEEHKLKLSEAGKGKKVINTETGVIYNTIKEAAEKEGFKNTTLWAMLRGQNPNKTNLILI